MYKFKSLYSGQELWFLYLICSLPLNFWTLLLSFRDVSWVMERTNVWDAIGVIAYGLIFALIESVIVFSGCVLLGFLVPQSLGGGPVRITLLGALVLGVSGLAVLSQAYFVWGWEAGAAQIAKLASLSDHPLRVLYGMALIPALFVTVVPVYFMIMSEKFLRSVHSLLDRLTVVAVFYLLLDLAALVIVVVRNI